MIVVSMPTAQHPAEAHFAAFLIADTVHELQSLGHSTIRLTADLYGHVLPTRARAVADAIDRVIGDLG
jgi:hypothetical protein